MGSLALVPARHLMPIDVQTRRMGDGLLGVLDFVFRHMRGVVVMWRLSKIEYQCFVEAPFCKLPSALFGDI
jgi:hypothetical protein